MTATTVGTVDVPGASLHYRVRGSGPVLLVLQGGDGGAEGSDVLGERFVDDYTVVTYDRRGLSRSTMQEPTNAPSLEVHGDDAHRVLAAATTEPAVVLGFSIGALIGLDLAARHPRQVRVLLAHEPPALRLLPDAQRDHAVRVHEDVVATYHREGLAAALPKMLAMVGVATGNTLPAPTAQRVANLEFFLAHDLPAVLRYRPDIAALKAVSARILVACGRMSGEVATHHCARALAHELGRQIVEFPGGHAGFASHPTAFAARLREVLASRG